MSQIPISGLDPGATPSGTEDIPAVQSGSTIRLTADQIATLAQQKCELAHGYVNIFDDSPKGGPNEQLLVPGALEQKMLLQGPFAFSYQVKPVHPTLGELDLFNADEQEIHFGFDQGIAWVTFGFSASPQPGCTHVDLILAVPGIVPVPLGIDTVEFVTSEDRICWASMMIPLHPDLNGPLGTWLGVEPRNGNCKIWGQHVQIGVMGHTLNRTVEVVPPPE